MTESYVHVRSLEKYHPGYKDRKLVWAKIYFDLVQGDPDFELLESEIDKWRYVAMICLELQHQAPLPNKTRYWQTKGFDLKKRPMSLTLQTLQKFVEVVTDEGGQVNAGADVTEASTLPLQDRNVDKRRGDKEKSRAKSASELISFCESLKLPSSDGEHLWYKWEENGWMNGKQPIKDWQLTVRSWERAGYLPSQKNGAHTPPVARPTAYFKGDEQPDPAPLSPETKAEIAQTLKTLEKNYRMPDPEREKKELNDAQFRQRNLRGTK